MNWVPHEDGHRCTRHGETFRRGEVCQRCVTDPPPPLDGDDDDVADPELEALYNEIRTREKKLWRIGEEHLDSGGRDVQTGVKVVAECTKLARLALEIRDRLTTKRDLATLIKKYRALIESDGGASH